MISALEVRDLAVGRGERLLFRGLSFQVRAGEAVALIGANGSGKTSLLRAVAGLLRPLEGEIAFLSGEAPVEKEEARGRGLHLHGHQDGLKASRTVREELYFQSRWSGGTRESALVAADRLDIRRLLELEVRMLSAGQRRRLALARLVASPRPLWLLDEPLAPLDTAHRAAFGEIMATHVAGGGLVLAAVHDPLPIIARMVEIRR